MAAHYGDKLNTHTIETNNDTNIKIIRLKYFWTIDNFNLSHQKTGRVMDSPIFPDNSIDKLKFYLKLYPKGNIDDFKEYASIFLHLKSGNRNQKLVSFECSISILNENFKTKFKKQTSVENDKLLTLGDLECGWSNFVRRIDLLNKLNGFLLNDKLIILCEISFSLLDHLSIPWKNHNIALPERYLSDDFELMFRNEEFSDVTLSAVGEEFRVHKCVLAARSSIFKNMFYHNLIETQQNRVEIENVNPKILKELLRYIYTGRVYNLEELAGDLLLGADKFGLEKLKLICGEILIKKLSVKNVIRTYILADVSCLDDVKTSARDFLNVHSKMVINSDEWKSMIKTHPHLITKAYLALTTLQTPSEEPPAKQSRRVVYFVDK